MMVTGFEGLTKVRQNNILLLGFDRPAHRNAITRAMYVGLADALLAANVDQSIRCVVLHGSETTFTAGNDIRDFANAASNDGPRPSAGFMHAVLELDKPLVAAVNGSAVGIGATMLLHCDLVFAGNNASLSFPFVRLGLCPEFGSTLLLSRRVGAQRAAQLLLLGETCSADKALALGLFNEVVAPHETLPLAIDAAHRLASAPADAVSATRKLLRKFDGNEAAERLKLENEYFTELLRGPAARAAFSSFLSKPSPEQRTAPDATGAGEHIAEENSSLDH